MGASQLREGDADLMLQVVEEGRRDDTGEPVPWALLEGLQRLIPCDGYVSFQCHDYRRRETLLMQGVGEDLDRETVDRDALAERAAEVQVFWAHFWQAACSYPQRTGDLRTVLTSTDFFPTERARLADPYRDPSCEVRYRCR